MILDLVGFFSQDRGSTRVEGQDSSSTAATFISPNTGSRLGPGASQQRCSGGRTAPMCAGAVRQNKEVEACFPINENNVDVALRYNSLRRIKHWLFSVYYRLKFR